MIRTMDMRRVAGTLATTAALIVGAAVPASAAGAHVAVSRSSLPPTLSADVQTVVFCVDNPTFTGCTPDGTAAAIRRVYASTTNNAAVVQICAERTYFNHPWRMAFCRGVILGVRPSPDNAWARDGIHERADVAAGILPVGF